MSDQLIFSANRKVEPSLHKVNRTSSISTSHGKNRIKSLCYSCRESTCKKVNTNAIICEDGVKIFINKCDKCPSTICNCSLCGTIHNFCKDKRAANRHRREKYRVNQNNSNMIEEKDVAESNEVNLATNGGFDAMDTEKELNYVNFISDLNLKDDKHREFTKHLNEDTSRHYLVAMS